MRTRIALEDERQNNGMVRSTDVHATVADYRPNETVNWRAHAMQPRSCPMCGETAGETVLELEADEFCRTNWTYARDFRALLRLPAQATFAIRRCSRCRFVHAALRPDDAFLATLYDRVISDAECVTGS